MADKISLEDFAGAPQADAGASVTGSFDKPQPMALEDFAGPAVQQPAPPAQMSGVARAAALPASNFAEGVLQTLSPFAGAVSDPSGTGFGVTEQMRELGPQLPAAAMEGAKEAGIIQRPDLEPQNTLEKGVASAARGAGRAIPTAVLTGPASIPLTLATGAGGGVLGDVAETAFPNHPAIAQTVGNVIGSAGVAGATSLVQLAARALTPLAEAGGRAVSAGAVDTQAAARLAQAMQQDIDSGAVTAADFQNAAAKGLQPWELENAENTRGLAGAITRSGGPARTTMRQYVKSEDMMAPQRLEGAVNNAFTDSMGPFDINATTEQIQNSQKATAAPLYDRAFQGGSIAPLQDQLRTSLITATGQKGQIAKQIAQIEQDSPGALAARGAAGADIRAKYMDLHQQLNQAEADRQATMQMFQRAQGDAASNAPGAVWSPRIQQFLDDPIMKGGLQRGLQIQRIESVAQGRPFNTTEYGITGQDASGNPIVGNVPNMRLLDAGKRGLDAIIGDNTDAVTGKVNEMGRAVTQFKKSYLTELDQLNPDYAAARAAWSGPAQSLNAIRQGSLIGTKSGAEVASDLADLSPADRQLYRLSAVQQHVLPRMNAGTMGSNEAGKLLANSPEQLKPQLEALFPDQGSRDAVLAAAQRANLKFQAKQAISGGSQTIERGVDQLGINPNTASNVGHAIAGAGAIAAGEPFVGMGYLGRLVADIAHHRISVSPDMNARIAQLLTSADQDQLGPVFNRLTPPGGIPRAAPTYPVTLAGQAAVPLATMGQRQ